MSPEQAPLTEADRAALAHTVLDFQRLEEQFENLEQQQHAAAFGMWLFLATEVMFFGALFLAVGAYHHMYTEAVEKASEKLNWLIGGVNTLVLLVSSLMMALAVRYARLGRRKALTLFLALTALLGVGFMVLKGVEYYTDYEENLIPGWRFDESEWIEKEGLRPDQVPHVKLFLLLYWIMTGVHGLHVTIGIAIVLIVAWLAWKGTFNVEYNAPVEVVGLYWHFVDTVWIFLLPMLYLLGTHTL